MFALVHQSREAILRPNGQDKLIVPPRFPLQCPIEFSGGNVAGEGTVLNISEHGWKAVSAQSVSQGTCLALRIALPDGGPPMKVDLAVVRWSREREFGLEHLVMGAEERERLGRFVEALETGQTH